MGSPEMVVGSLSAPKKALGQHWLHDMAILQAICLSAEISPGDIVLEIGPGLGTLTRELLELGANVIALEYDHDLAVNLTSELKNRGIADTSNLQVIEGDIRSFDFTTLPKNYKIVANIPYYLTSYLMRSLSDTDNKPLIGAILMQKEVAERIASEKNKNSLLSVFVQYSYDCSLGTIVGKEYFTPPPKVDSQVLILQKRVKPIFDANRKYLVRLFKAGFSEKRKNLRNALSGGLGIDKVTAETILGHAGISFERRAESLSWDEWGQLYLAFLSSGVIN